MTPAGQPLAEPVPAWPWPPSFQPQSLCSKVVVLEVEVAVAVAKQAQAQFKADRLETRASRGSVAVPKHNLASD